MDTPDRNQMNQKPTTPETKQESTNQDLEREKLLPELEIKRKELEKIGSPSPRKPWWTLAVEFLALPTAVIGLAVAFTTASGNVSTERKTAVETEQIKANLNKAAEAGRLATDLSEKEKQGPKAFEQAVAQNANKIKESLERLQRLEEQNARITVQTTVLKFVLLWILFIVVGLIFDIIGAAWSVVVNTSSLFMYEILNSRREKYSEKFEKRRRLLQRLVHGLVIVLGQVPNVLRWSIQLSIFAVLLGPLFNEISVAFGSGIQFNDVLREAKHLHFGAMLSLMRQLLFTH